MVSSIDRHWNAIISLYAHLSAWVSLIANKRVPSLYSPKSHKVNYFFFKLHRNCHYYTTALQQQCRQRNNDDCFLLYLHRMHPGGLQSTIYRRTTHFDRLISSECVCSKHNYSKKDLACPCHSASSSFFLSEGKK